ncbi:MAG TPA: tetratricopeptide repeat protein [Pyrinomonadaceae bacterium]|nr:tetratricopeptide repeat protein [Pyrinomonadaceae bacterium]
MDCSVRPILPAFLLCLFVLAIVVPARAQQASVSPRAAITVLDSTKEQDGLIGSVRRVKTETARIELKDGRVVEGPPQLVEITTYGIKGNRIENTSYPIAGSLAGKEEYKYDERGNITEMTVRDDRGAILSREAYTYEFDKFGNWTKMVTSLVVFENGELKREPTEVTYRTLTYYFDDNVAKAVEEPKAVPVVNAPAVPDPANVEIRSAEVVEPAGVSSVKADSVELAGVPPSLTRSVPVKSASSAAHDLYLAGRTRFDNGDAPGAIDSYLQSLALEPGSAEVYLSLGHAYINLKKDKEAIKAFKESTKLNPNLAETQYGLGFANFRLGRFREAADAFKRATTLEPQMAKAHYGLSLAYQELGNNIGLMEEYRILEKLDKSLAKKLAQTFPQFNFSCRAMRGCP